MISTILILIALGIIVSVAFIALIGSTVIVMQDGDYLLGIFLITITVILALCLTSSIFEYLGM